MLRDIQTRFDVKEYEKKAFIKNGKSRYWFWVDCKKIAFCYHFAHKDELKTIALNSDTVTHIYEIIDDLIANYYKATHKSLKKGIEEHVKPKEKKPEKLKKQNMLKKHAYLNICNKSNEHFICYLK